MKSPVVCLFAALAFTGATLAANVFTHFDIPADTPYVSSFSSAASGLFNLGQLSQPGPYTRDVVYSYFTPGVSGTYTIGIASASFDPVLIVYQGQNTFPSLAPGEGAIALNDDGSVFSFEGLAFSNSGTLVQFNPLIRDLFLTAGTNYLVATTSWSSNQQIPLPMSFFVYGSNEVSVNGAPVSEPSVVPEPSAAMLGSLALIPLLRRRRR